MFFSLNPNKAGLFEGSFFWEDGGQFDDNNNNNNNNAVYKSFFEVIFSS